MKREKSQNGKFKTITFYPRIKFAVGNGHKYLSEYCLPKAVEALSVLRLGENISQVQFTRYTFQFKVPPCQPVLDKEVFDIDVFCPACFQVISAEMNGG